MGFFPTGIGWYRKTFRLPAGARGRDAWLEFDGVYMNSDVWINGVHLGRRPYGYASFAYDVTRHLVPGVNVVAVRVDNSRQPNSRWYTGSGIYRHVWLTIADRLHVGHWGTYVTTPRADSAGADVVARTRVENGYGAPREGVLRSVVVDSAGREVARTRDAVLAGCRAARSSWSSGCGSSRRGCGRWTRRRCTRSTRPSWTARRRVDVAVTTFGIRTIAYDKDRGFLLNGRRVKMRGVNLHHDAGGLGAAVPERGLARAGSRR